MLVGSIRSLHRYPVKSLAGEELEAAEVGQEGLPGDRAFALRDDVVGEIRSAKQWPRLMLCSARYREEPTADFQPAAEITFPDGSTTATNAPDVSSRFSEWLGKKATLCPRMPASDKDHYRRAQPGASVAGFLAQAPMLRKAVARLATLGPAGKELRRDFGRQEDEPLPDLSVFPAELFEYVSPLGTYFDAYPIHVLTSATLFALREHLPDADWDVRRFRPNIFVDTGPDRRGLLESEWAGRTLRIGQVRLACTVLTPRCSMVIQPQPDLPKNPSILRTIVKDASQCVGVYARVVQPGPVRLGDTIELE